MTDKLINWYENPKVRKYVKDLPDKQFEKTQMKLDKPHVLLTGAQGSGKSVAMMNYIYRTNNTFKKIFMVIEKIEPFIEFLMNELKDHIEIFRGLDEMPKITEFQDACKMKDPCRYLLIFDDQIVNLMRSKANQVKVNDYFCYGRNKNIQTLFLTQSYFATPKFIRLNVSYVILCSIRSKRDLNLILSEYNVSDISSEMMFKIWEYCSTLREDEQFSFMKIATFHTPINKKITRNFVEYIDINSFKVPTSSHKKKRIRDSDEEDEDEDEDD